MKSKPNLSKWVLKKFDYQFCLFLLLNVLTFFFSFQISDENLHPTFQQLGGTENILSHIQRYIIKPQNAENVKTHLFILSLICLILYKKKKEKQSEINNL